MPDAAMRVQLTTKEKADLIDVTQPWRLIGPVKSKALIDWTLRGVCEAYNKAEPIMWREEGARHARLLDWGGGAVRADGGKLHGAVGRRTDVIVIVILHLLIIVIIVIIVCGGGCGSVRATASRSGIHTAALDRDGIQRPRATTVWGKVELQST